MWWDDDQLRVGDGQMCTSTKPGEGACHVIMLFLSLSH